MIKDRNDPSGFGMFSKAGRFTTEKYSNAIQQFQSLFQRPVRRDVERMATETPSVEFVFEEENENVIYHPRQTE
jgi:hypothetical protein